MTVIVTQTHALDGEQVKCMIADHYQANNVPVVAQNITHRVHDGGGGGFSSSGPFLGDTIIYFHGQKRVVGMPESITLRPLQIQEIAAEFFGRALGLAVTPSQVRIEVSGSGGSGMSRSSASLKGLSVHSTRTVG